MIGIEAGEVEVEMISDKEFLKLIAEDEGYAEILDDIGKSAESRARQLVPVRTGALRNSIGYEVDGLDLTVTAEEDYAAHVEMGTSRMAAQPYLRPAIESAMQEHTGDMQ